MWTAANEGPAPVSDPRILPSALAISPDGSHVYVATQGGNSADIGHGATIAYDAATGTRRWGASETGYVVSSVAVSADGTHVYVSGVIWDPEQNQHYLTIAYKASSGEEVWRSRYSNAWSRWNGERWQGLPIVAASPDGSNVYVIGAGWDLAGLHDYVAIAYEEASGTERWVSNYNSPGDGEDLANSVAISPDGSRLFVTGSSANSSSGGDYLTAAYDADTGVRLWTARFDGAEHLDDWAWSVAVSPDGNRVFVAGEVTADDTFTDYLTLAYDAQGGHQVWSATYGNIGGSDGDDNWPSRIEVDPSGSRVYMVGSSFGDRASRTSAYLAASYNAATGNQLWVSHYIGPLETPSRATSITLSPNGATLYVSGWSNGVGTSLDYATVGFEATTGAQVWASRYNGPENDMDLVSSIAVSPNGGRVFVTGESGGTSPVNLTVSYDTVASCVSGSSEEGPASKTMHDVVEPLAGPGASYVHELNCGVLVPAGL